MVLNVGGGPNCWWVIWALTVVDGRGPMCWWMMGYLSICRLWNVEALCCGE